jgi:hypothetical protein
LAFLGGKIRVIVKHIEVQKSLKHFKDAGFINLATDQKQRIA